MQDLLPAMDEEKEKDPPTMQVMVPVMKIKVTELRRHSVSRNEWCQEEEGSLKYCGIKSVISMTRLNTTQ